MCVSTGSQLVIYAGLASDRFALLDERLGWFGGNYQGQRWAAVVKASVSGTQGDDGLVSIMFSCRQLSRAKGQVPVCSGVD